MREKMREKIAALNRAAGAFEDTDAPRCLELAREAYRLATIAHDAAGIAWSHARQAHALAVQTSYIESLAHARKALLAFRPLGDTRGLVAAYHQVGIIYMMTGQYPKARVHFEQSLALSRRLRDAVACVMNLGNLGTLHYYQGNFTAAKREYEAARRLMRGGVTVPGAGGLLANLGALHVRTGKLREGQRCIVEGIAGLEAGGNQAQLAMALNNLAEVHRQLGEPAAALAALHRSLRQARAMSVHRV